MAGNLLGVAAGVGIAALGSLSLGGSDKNAGNPSEVTTYNGSPRVTFEGIDKYYRATLKVPDSYITQYAHGPLFGFNGIVFPYTPVISYDMTAAYSNMNVMHSNYAVNFYKHSSVGNITLTAKFTVNSDVDAVYYITTMHLLRALTKMRYGSDTDAGAPPPVCRLSAYGDFMLKNVPVAVSSFKTEYPDGVDYYATGQDASALSQELKLGTNFIPTVSSITLGLIPMYSREEQSKFSVTDYINDPALKKAGYL
jgi:hypothetical protein